jgi:hypothetical protein
LYVEAIVDTSFDLGFRIDIVDREFGIEERQWPLLLPRPNGANPIHNPRLTIDLTKCRFRLFERTEGPVLPVRIHDEV